MDRENDDGLEFLVAAYRQLAHGAALGESIRVARSELHQRSGVADVARLQAELYGDGRLVIFVKDMSSRVEDNLRQVTIMSLDLVGSTRLIATLGAERYSEVLAEYHKRCEQIVAGCGGAPDDPQGDDGIMLLWISRRPRGRCQPGGACRLEDHRCSSPARLERADRHLDRAGRWFGTASLSDRRSTLPLACNQSRCPERWSSANSTHRIVKERFRFEPLENVPLLKGFISPGRFSGFSVWHRLTVRTTRAPALLRRE